MKFFIKTFGCQMNVRDAEWMAGQLLSHGWHKTEEPSSADLLIIYTCSVRRHAEDRAFSFLGRLKKLKEKRAIKIILAGCTAEAEGEKLLRQFPYLDGIYGPAQEKELLNNIDTIYSQSVKLKAIGDRTALKNFNSEADYRNKNITAFVTIMEGCDNFCSYCIVPYLRGRQRYRSLDDIVQEVVYLKEKGYKEVTLLGQNVTSFHYNNLRSPSGFVRLLEEINKTGIERIRFMTSHPKDVNEELFLALRDLAHVCEHLHLPVQAGSDKILKLMNRKYSRDDYLRLIDKLRKILPQCSLTTDIIVGFPGEEEEDFEMTLELMRKVEFDVSFIFKYSPRPKTSASRLEDNVPQKEKERRNLLALELQKEISRRKAAGYLGKTEEVLIEAVNEKGMLLGKTRGNYNVLLQGKKELIGEIVKVKIVSHNIHSLEGEICQ